MEMTSMQSSNIKASGYDAGKKDLRIEFTSGSYTYHDVPSSVFDAFMAAESKGRFFAASIKGRFPHTKG